MVVHFSYVSNFKLHKNLNIGLIELKLRNTTILIRMFNFKLKRNHTAIVMQILRFKMHIYHPILLFGNFNSILTLKLLVNFLVQITCYS